MCNSKAVIPWGINSGVARVKGVRANGTLSLTAKRIADIVVWQNDRHSTWNSEVSKLRSSLDGHMQIGCSSEGPSGWLEALTMRSHQWRTWLWASGQCPFPDAIPKDPIAVPEDSPCPNVMPQHMSHRSAKIANQMTEMDGNWIGTYNIVSHLRVWNFQDRPLAVHWYSSAMQ